MNPLTDKQELLSEFASKLALASGKTVGCIVDVIVTYVAVSKSGVYTWTSSTLTKEDTELVLAQVIGVNASKAH
jgi:hypothetical protein